jgi:glutamate dehydrogenase/leucine dehydrogenase
MENAYDDLAKAREKFAGISWRQAAFVVAIDRILTAMKLRGSIK